MARLTPAQRRALLCVSVAEKMRGDRPGEPLTQEEQTATLVLPSRRRSGSAFQRVRPDTWLRLQQMGLVNPNIGRGMTLTDSGRRALTEGDNMDLTDAGRAALKDGR